MTTQQLLNQQADETRGEQQVSIEDIGPARKRLVIEVPAERITGKIASGFTELQSEAVIPGFRRGRVPLRLLQKRFGDSLRDEVRTKLISECYSQAIEDEKIDVVGEPDIKDLDQIQLPEDGPLKFEVEVEVAPDVQLPDLKGIPVVKKSVEVSDEDVQTEIKRQQERFGNLEKIDGPIKPGQHVAEAHVRILEGTDAADDAPVIGDLAELRFPVPGKDDGFKGQVAGIIVDDLGQQMKGKTCGDEVSVSLTGPSGHEDERIKDKPITIRIQVKAVHEQQPASIEDLLSTWGIETEEEFRTRTRELLEHRAQQDQVRDTHEQASAYLMENVSLDLPEGLTGRQTARLLRREAMELAYRGFDQQQIEQKIAEMRQQQEELARRELKRYFILDQAAKQLEIQVTDNEINGRIASMAMQMGRRPEKLRQQMRRDGELESLYVMIREHKTLDRIVQDAAIQEDESGSSSKKPSTGKKGKSKSKAAKADDDAAAES